MSKKQRVFVEEELVIVEIDGDLLVWEGGDLKGPSHLVDNAHWASEKGIRQSLGEGGEDLISDLNNPSRPEQAAAAMMAARPLRAQIVKAPERVWRWVPTLQALFA